MLDEMRESGINCAFMWSLCPETYSYAYFEALAANLFIITNRNSGNIAYLTCKNKNGIVYNELSDLISDLRLNKLHSKLQQYIGNPDLAGPESYITNSQIKELYGREKYEFLPYSEGDRVNPFVKKTMEFFYLKKNKR